MMPAMGKQDVGPRRTGGQQDVAGGESRPRFANWARGAGLLGHSGAAQRCGPCRRKHHGQSETRANRAMRHCVRQPHNVARGGAKGRRWQRSSKDVGRRQTAGQSKRSRRRIERVCEHGMRRGPGWTSRRRATVRAASSHTARPERDARGTPAVAWRTANSQRPARQHTTAPQALGRVRRRAATGGRATSHAFRRITQRFANWARAKGLFGHGGAAQLRGPHRRKQHDRRRSTLWHGARRDHGAARGNNPTTPRVTARRCLRSMEAMFPNNGRAARAT